MGIVRMGPPHELIKSLATDFSIHTFIETGTYHGDTAIWASQYFQKVFTIEYSKELYEHAIQRVQQISNIECIFGDSRDELPKILPRLEGSSLFWLDAHWSGQSTYGEADECPLLDEIKILKTSSFNDFIFIDDARLFTSPPPAPHKIEAWPNITAIIHELHDGDNERYIVIIEDEIIAVPGFAKALLAQYCQAVNTKAWEEYGRQLKTSEFQQGAQLLWNVVRRKSGNLSRKLFAKKSDREEV